MKVTVVGAGIYGLATAWALARRGHRVTVLDQGPIPNPAASSVDEHRVIRATYGARKGYTRLIPEAHRAWDLLWQDLGERLYVETGTLILADAKSSWPRESARTLERLGRRIEWLGRGELGRRFPLIDPTGVEQAFHLTDGGALLAGRIVAALARHLVARTVILRPHTRAVLIDPERAAVMLSDASRIEADALVVAAGAWITKLRPDLGLRLTPSRQVVLYMEPPAELAGDWTRAPVVIDVRDDAGFYLLPPVAGTRLKVGGHHFSRSGDPDADRTPGDEDGAAIPTFCRARLRGFDRFRLLEKRICFYTVTEEERFVVEPLAARTLLVSACSGHGFKFGAVMGLKIAAALGDAEATSRLTLEAASHPD